MKGKRKIGILGGTFDPIHNAHLMLGEMAYRQFELDEVLFMPAKQPPHKIGKEISPVQDRIAMVRLAIADKPYFSCSEFELGLPGKSYTAQTLTALHELDSNAEYFFILGGDSLFSLAEWYEPEIILKNAVLLAAAREDFDRIAMQAQIDSLTGRYGGDIRLLYTPMMEISSSDIRERVIQEKPIRELVPETVENYIRKYALYLDGREEIVRLKQELAGVLDSYRLTHTFGVAGLARHLAGLYGAPADKAYLAGLLHDCAKHFSGDELLRRCRDQGLEVTEVEEKEPQLLHAKYGAWLARNVYGVEDEEICSAIACHTTGKPGMNLLEKIIFTADYLEPGRTKARNLKMLRALAETDLDRTIYHILRDTLDYLGEREMSVDPTTAETYAWIERTVGTNGETSSARAEDTQR